METLLDYGYTDYYRAQAELYPDLSPARIIAQYKNLYRLITLSGIVLGGLSGKFIHSHTRLNEYPAVGDFVMADLHPDSEGHVVIHTLLHRRSTFVRKAVGHEHEVQVIAANIEKLFICMSLNQDFNLRRLERYLAIAWESGATPVVILTKKDLGEDIDLLRAGVDAVAIGVNIVETSIFENTTRDTLLSYLRPGSTSAFIGSSGVGKSSLINIFLDTEQIATGGIRDNDDKGKHTTTRRELYRLLNGALVIDTPGLREIGADSVNLDKGFEDIELLAEKCRFTNCTHTNEPGCAVLDAVENNTLAAERLQSYQKLKTEAGYAGLNSRQIEEKKTEKMFSEIGGRKNMKKFIKEKNRQKNR